MKNILMIAVLVCNAIISTAQESAYHCYPTNWWAGMKWNKVQVILHGNGISTAAGKATINYPGVQLLKVYKVENSNYLFLDLIISAATKPGIAKIRVVNGDDPIIIDFPIKARRKVEREEIFAQGVTSKGFYVPDHADRFRW